MRLISVIVPAYNAERTISRCLESIIRESYENLEIIVVDDGSTDKTADICKEYAFKDNRIKFIQQENAGVVAARVKALLFSTGEYISFVDADDTVSEKMHEIMLKTIIEMQTDIVVCGYTTVDSDHIEKCIPEEKIINSSYGIMNAYLNEGLKGFLWNKLYKREFFVNFLWPNDMDIAEDLYCNAVIVANNP